MLGRYGLTPIRPHATRGPTSSPKALKIGTCLRTGVTPSSSSVPSPRRARRHGPAGCSHVPGRLGPGSARLPGDLCSNDSSPAISAGKLAPRRAKHGRMRPRLAGRPQRVRLAPPLLWPMAVPSRLGRTLSPETLPGSGAAFCVAWSRQLEKRTSPPLSTCSRTTWGPRWRSCRSSAPPGPPRACERAAGPRALARGSR